MARWRWWRQFSILTIFSDCLVINGSKTTISLSRHLLVILAHCNFAYFFENYPQKSNFAFYASKKEIAYHYSRMKSGKNINSSLWKRLSSFYFQSDQQFQKHFTKHWKDERNRGLQARYSMLKDLYHHFWQSHWSAWP